MNSEECELRWQKQFGILYEDNAFIIFQAQVIDLSSVVSVKLSYHVEHEYNYRSKKDLVSLIILNKTRVYDTTG